MQVCDQPHPLLISEIVKNCTAANIDGAYDGMKVLLLPFALCTLFLGASLDTLSIEGGCPKFWRCQVKLAHVRVIIT